MYKKVKDLSGHIADIGIWKGGSFFSFIKFVSLFEKIHKLWFMDLIGLKE